MRTLALLLGLLSLSVAAPAGAQRGAYRLTPPAEAPDETGIDEARQRFAEGSAFVEQGRWADALARFEDAFRRSGVPAALFNAATTLRSMGRHRDARDAFDQLLEMDSLDNDTRALAAERRTEEARRVARLELSGLAEHAEARVVFDGLELPTEEGDLVQLETDPGRHGVLVEERGYRPWRQELDLADGERVRLQVELRELPAASPEIVVHTDREEVWESPVFWTVALLVFAAGGAGLAAYLYDDAQLTTRPGFELTVFP